MLLTLASRRSLTHCLTPDALMLWHYRRAMALGEARCGREPFSVGHRLRRQRQRRPPQRHRRQQRLLPPPVARADRRRRFGWRDGAVAEGGVERRGGADGGGGGGGEGLRGSGRRGFGLVAPQHSWPITGRGGGSGRRRHASAQGVAIVAALAAVKAVLLAPLSRACKAHTMANLAPTPPRAVAAPWQRGAPALPFAVPGRERCREPCGGRERYRVAVRGP